MECAAVHKLCRKVSSGGTPSRKKPEYYTNDSKGHRWVKSKELLDGPVSDTEEKITDEGLNKSAAKCYPANTVLMAMYGANVGQLGWLKRPATVNQAVCAMVVNEDVANFRYVFYALLHTRKGLIAKAQGAAQQNLNQGLIRDFKIPKPDLLIQCKIAAILSAYDDLIENNTRRIQILEEMARTIYREWFVNFRFPGHGKVKMVESDLGPIPEGWEVRRLGDVCDIVMGQSPSSQYYNQNGEGLPFHQGVTNFGTHFPSDRIYCTSLNRIAEKGDILFSVRAPVGRINIANKKIVIGRGICAIRSKNGNQAFVLYQLNDKFREEDSMGGGTIFKAVTKDDMLGIKTLVPLEPIVSAFQQVADPLVAELEALTKKNANLRQTRDLLLPKLISGELDVSELDISTGGLEP